MKIRVQIPADIRRDDLLTKEYIDDVLYWGLETDIHVSHYTTYYGERVARQGGPQVWNFNNLNGRERYAVFTVQPEDVFMFSLRWNATQHKSIIK